MSTLYLESSALLCWINGEPEASRVRAAMDQAGTLVTSILTPLEIKRCLIRREAAREITASVKNRLAGFLEQNLLGWELLELSQEILGRAAQPFPVEPVRSLDAIHLATILEAVKVYPDITVLSMDTRILQNLGPMGFEGSSPILPSGSESR